MKRAIRAPVSQLRRAGPVAPAARPSTPASAPPAAGRSPKHKRIGILSRKRTAASPFTRVDPPGPADRRPATLSIDAALRGTLARPAKRPAAPADAPVLGLDPRPAAKGWFFDIHEDTLEDTLTNLMEHSASTLDISDDEGRRRESSDRGKENVPPGADATPIGSIAAPRPAKAPRAPRAKRTSNPFAALRTPLADLKPDDFCEDDDVAGPGSPSFAAAAKKAAGCAFQLETLTAAAAPTANPFAVASDAQQLADAAAAAAAEAAVAAVEWPCSNPAARREFRGNSP